MTPEKQAVFDWIDQNRARLSDHHLTIWSFAEPAWREYRSAAFYWRRLSRGAHCPDADEPVSGDLPPRSAV